MSLAIITGVLEDQQGRSELLWNDPGFTGRFGELPPASFVGRDSQPLLPVASDAETLTDNLGANNLKIANTIRYVQLCP